MLLSFEACSTLECSSETCEFNEVPTLFELIMIFEILTSMKTHAFDWRLDLQ